MLKKYIREDKVFLTHEDNLIGVINIFFDVTNEKSLSIGL